MRRSRLPTVARQLAKELSDADLLEQYTEQCSDEAFGQLVARYSRLVWGQCRNLLSNEADAEDAFQATFLTLARSVRKLRPGAPLGPWLHGVAYRVCKNAQRAKAARAKREKAAAHPEGERPLADSLWSAAFAAVSEEVQKLPDAQRAAFVLCCLEGRTQVQAAAALGQKIGTFSAHLNRVKQTLLDRLTQRGFGVGAIALGGITGSVAVAPASLIDRTRSLLPSGVVVPSSIQVLMHGVTGMSIVRFKALAAGLLVAAGVSLSVGSGWYSSASGQPAPTASGPAASPPSIEKLKADLEKAKAELAKAEKEQSLKRAAELLQAKEAKAASKFEYEPVPGGGYSPEEFEKKLAEREKAGWAYLGEATIRGKSGTGPTLVFRKQPQTFSATNRFGFLDPVPGEKLAGQAFTTPLTFTYQNPGPVPLINPLAPVAPPTPAAPAATGPAPLRPATPPTPANNPFAAIPAPQPLITNDRLPPNPGRDDSQARIAQLEKLVEELRAAKGAGGIEKKVTITFTEKDFGAWKAGELMGIVDRLIQDEHSAEKNSWMIQNDQTLQFTGPQKTVDEVKTLVKKLRR